ncbi:MAG: sulfatase-like hydrolase/transferase [Legionellales bacterium]|nr:sulfatase-like hydrolase/transferase [Legionellales bacterium]
MKRFFKLFSSIQFDQTWRWLGWLILLSTVFSWGLGFYYLTAIFPIHLPFVSTTSQVTITVMIIITFAVHFLMLTSIWLTFTLLPGILLVRHRSLWLSLWAVMTMVFAALVLLVDGYIFHLYRFHLNAAIVQFIVSGEINEIFALSSREWQLSLAIVITLALVSFGLTQLAWYLARHPTGWRLGHKITLTAITLLGLSYVSFALTASQNSNDFSLHTKALPWYDTLLTTLLPLPLPAGRNLDTFSSDKFNQLTQATLPLRYPLHPLECQTPQNPPNIVIILVDTWRPDTITPTLMPFVDAFRQRTWQFTQHYSGGNSTRAGLVSLFYSIAGTYWSALLKEKRRPVLLEVLADQGYQLKIFNSGVIYVPQYHQTLYYGIDDLRLKTPGETAAERDQVITKEFVEFIQERSADAPPFFNFLHYDSAHSYCLKQHYPTPSFQDIEACNRLLLDANTDPTPLVKRYHNATRFVDSQIKQVLQALEQQPGGLSNTLVIITSDHGQEFNDNGNNYWEHASGYTDYQLHVPLLIYWPNQSPKIYTHLTTHYDIVPTLLQEISSCRNPIADYSMGYHLLDSRDRSTIFVSSYSNFGIVEPHQVTTIFTSGNIVVTDRQGNVLPEAKPSAIGNALTSMRRYFKE